MNTTLLLALFGALLLIGNTQADCGSAASSSDDGELTSWFKNVGCKIKEGVGELQESAKPWTEKISSTAKDLSSAVVQKYDDLKHKITDSAESDESNTPLTHIDASTEKIPLAPLTGSEAAASHAAEHGAASVGVPAAVPATTGETHA